VLVCLARAIGLDPASLREVPEELDPYSTWHNYPPLGELDPFLVLPGYAKAFDVRANATLWYKPKFAFAATHDVFIIGLGLAPDDFLLRSLFLSNLPFINSFSGVLGRKIFIINLDLQAESSYDFVLSRGRADLLNSRFSEEHINLMIQRKGNA